MIFLKKIIKMKLGTFEIEYGVSFGNRGNFIKNFVDQLEED